MKAIWLLAILPLALVGCIPGLSIRVDPNGCLPSGYCAGAGTNGYAASERAVVLAPDYTPVILAHELCHVHQHEEVLESLGREPDNTLRAWYLTAEGQDFLAHYVPLPEFSQEALEDAAWVCARYYLEPEALAPENLAWAERWLAAP